MVDLEPLITQVRVTMVVALSELGTGGVYEAEHADTLPWVDLPVPYAVILIEDVPRSEMSPLDEQWAQPQVQLFYVAAVNGGSSGIRGKLQTLRAAFWPGGAADPLATAQVGQVLAEPDWGWSASLAPNAIFRRDNVLRRAGRLVLDVLVAGS